MASPDLNVYDRYKARQDEFANFLGQTGRLCQAPSHLTELETLQQAAPPPPCPSKSRAGQGRLKGKERKLAKEKAKASAKVQPATKKTFALRLRNYIPLAQHVADSKSVHSIIPDWIITTLETIIQDRKATFDHYSSQDEMSRLFTLNEELQRDNEKHEYMIQILLRVQAILEAKHNDQKAREAAKAAKKGFRQCSKPRSQNKFPQEFNLDAENTEDETEEQAVDEIEAEKQRAAEASAWRAKTSASADVWFEAEVDVSFSDALSALGNLCAEWQAMREQVKQAWRGYADGSLDLGAVALTANTAIDLARHLEEAVRPVIARNDELCRRTIWKDKLDILPCEVVGSWKNIYAGLYHCVFNNTPALFNFHTADPTADVGTPKHGDLPPRDESQVARDLDFWLIQPFQFLEINHSLASSNLQPDADAASNDKPLTIPYGWTAHDVYPAMEDAVEMRFMARYAKNMRLTFVDEVSRAMDIVATEPDFRLWTAFAWQLFKDAQELLGPQSVAGAFDELQEFAEAGAGLLEDIVDQGRHKLNPSDYPTEVDVLAQGVLATLRAMRIDWVESYGKPSGCVNRAPWSQSQPFRLVRRHPVFCGLALQSARLWMQSLGTTLANTGSQAVMKMAHLYNMCAVGAKAKGGEDLEAWAAAGAWEDMDRLVLSLQPENVFIGGQAPTTLEDCAKNHALAIGLPLRMLDSSTARPKNTTLQGLLNEIQRAVGPRGRRKTLDFMGDNLYPVSDAFSERLAKLDTRRDFTVQDLSQILARGPKKEAQRPKPRPTARGGPRQPQTSDLLSDLLAQLNQEAPVLRSSSVRLHMDCMHLLREMDVQLGKHTKLDGLLDAFASLGTGMEDLRDDGGPPTGAKAVIVLSGRFEHLPIVAGVIPRWLKANGGNGAVSFPKPPSGGSS